MSPNWSLLHWLAIWAGSQTGPNTPVHSNATHKRGLSFLERSGLLPALRRPVPRMSPDALKVHDAPRDADQVLSFIETTAFDGLYHKPKSRFAPDDAKIHDATVSTVPTLSFLESRGLIPTYYRAGSRCAPRSLKIHSAPMSPPAPVPDTQLYLSGDPPPDRGRTLEWPYPG